MRLIMTRPEPQASRSARALITLGHEVILSPMLDIVSEPNVAKPKGDFQALLLTSSNAVAPGTNLVEHSVPVFTVGDETALAAKRAGFVRVRSAGGDVAALEALVDAELLPEAGALLYAVGRHQSGDLAGRLRHKGFSVTSLVVYRAEPRKKLADVATRALKEERVDGVLLYSQRSAEAFAAAVRIGGLAPLSRRVTLYCISPAASAPLRPVAQGEIAIAERPEQISLFALIEARTPGGSKPSH